MPIAVQDIIDLIDMRIKINREISVKCPKRIARNKEAKIEELEYLKETILLAYEQEV